MAALKVLSIAVASGRAGFVYLHGNQLLDWGIAVKATGSSGDLVKLVQQKISALRPDVVVTEKCGAGCKKGKRARRLIEAIAEIASYNAVLDVSVERTRRYQSKYEEADDLVARYPDLAGYQPKRKRRVFDFEPRGMIIFEALTFAEQVIHGPPEHLAAAMG